MLYEWHHMKLLLVVELSNSWIVHQRPWKPCQFEKNGVIKVHLQLTYQTNHSVQYHSDPAWRRKCRARIGRRKIRL